MGTPAYMAPEQCRGAGAVDARADVYALACVLYALISGAPPFQAEGLGQLLMMHICEPAPLLSTRAAGIHPALDAFVARCLAKDPAARPADGFAMLRELVELEAELARAATRGSTVFGTVAPPIPRREPTGGLAWTGLVLAGSLLVGAPGGTGCAISAVRTASYGATAEPAPDLPSTRPASATPASGRKS